MFVAKPSFLINTALTCFRPVMSIDSDRIRLALLANGVGGTNLINA